VSTPVVAGNVTARRANPRACVPVYAIRLSYQKAEACEELVESAIVKPNQSVLVPAGAKHGFRNLENTTLHVRATLAAPIFEASYGDRAETSRRWTPDHFDL
jgi:Mannose-6-phosphate isomerase